MDALAPSHLALLIAVPAVLLALLLRARNPTLTTITVGPIFLFVVGSILRVPQLYVMGAMMVGVCLLSGVFAWVSLRGITVTRAVPSPLIAGDTTDCLLEVRNTGRLPKFSLRVDAGLPSWLEAEHGSFLLGVLWPGQSVSLRTRVRARKRGFYPLDPVRIHAADPLGIFPRRRPFLLPAEVLVTPTVHPFSSVEMLGDSAYGSTTPRNSVLPGHGLDFHSLREYQAGDDLRRVDWKTSARLSRIVVTEYEPTTVGEVVLLLDNRPAAQDPVNTLELSVAVAASLLAQVLDDGGQVCLRVGKGDQPEEVEGRGPDSLPILLEALARVDGSGKLSPADLALGVPPERTLLLVTPATGEDVLEALHDLGGSGNAAVFLVDGRMARPAKRRDPLAGQLLTTAETLRRQGFPATVVGLGDLPLPHQEPTISATSST